MFVLYRFEIELVITLPDTGAQYCDEYVCLSDLYQIFVLTIYGRGLVLLRRRSDTIRISGFVNDVTYAHNLRLLDVAARLRR